MYKHSKKLTDDSNLINLYTNIGVLRYHMSKYSLALESYETVRHIEQKQARPNDYVSSTL